mgnify:CR=1 FL=1
MKNYQNLDWFWSVFNSAHGELARRRGDQVPGHGEHGGRDDARGI